MPHGCCLKHQLYSLRNKHEVSPGFRMSDRDRSAIPDLLFKDRQHAAITAQNITETHCDKTSALMLESQNNELGDSLGDTHDVGGLYGLVSGNHDKVLYLILPGHKRDIVCAKNVVGYR